MLYTRKGDDGTTNLYNSPKGERVSKSSCQTEALGALDELNSFMGLIAVRSVNLDWKLCDKEVCAIVAGIQNSLFICQAEIAGSSKKMSVHAVKEIETYTDAAENELPKIRSFAMAGGTEESAMFDYARALARKAERRVIAAVEEGKTHAGPDLLAYMNRLSSVLYALARFANFKRGVVEKAPWYN